MIINFRYHIFTITAIFAALGLGILIGSSIIGHEGLIEEQRNIIQNISKDINNLKNENKKLSLGISTLEDELRDRTNTNSIEKELILSLLNGYMKETKLLLLYNNLDQKKVDELSSYIKIMGADINLLNYQNIDKASFSLESEYSKFDRLISWNIDNSLDSLNLQDNANIEYNKKDVLGLLLNIINDFNRK